MQTLWLVRHEHRWDFEYPEWFETATYRYDPPLSPQGSVAAKLLVDKFADIEIDRIYTSPFLRAIQTAEPLARLRRLPLQLEWGLCEWLCCDWTTELPEVTPVEEVQRRYPNLVDVNYRSLVLPRYPETVDELYTRINNIADKLVNSNCQHAIAIAHKVCLLALAETLSGSAEWRDADLSCGGIIKLEWEGDLWRSSLVAARSNPI